MNIIPRKISDEIYKLIYRLTHSNRYKHNKKRWPHVKISRGEQGQISTFSYRGINIPIIDLQSLKNYCSGELLIIASGPSINDITFSHSNSVTTLGVNGSYSLKNKIDFNFYVISDIDFFTERSDIVKDIISNKNLILFLQVDGLVKIIDLFGEKSLYCKIVLIEDAFRLTYAPIMTLSEIENDIERSRSIYFYKNNFKYHEPIAFETNIENGVFPANTVVYWVLQIAAYLGFKKIYLAGVDMNNFHLPRFYETLDDITPSHLEIDLDTNIFPAFEHASEVMKKLNIEVINLSLNSALSDTIFKKKSYNEIFSIKKR